MHAARRLAKEFGDDPGKIMLKVDFSNAFKEADWTENAAEVYDKFPSLYRWVEYCYSHPAHLFFGTVTLQSMAGVQQGDPFDPLLFCGIWVTEPSLVMRKTCSSSLRARDLLVGLF